MAAQGNIVLVHAHPYPRRSRANKALLEAVEDLPGVSVRSLFDRYPDFAIDVDAEKAALTAADVVRVAFGDALTPSVSFPRERPSRARSNPTARAPQRAARPFALRWTAASSGEARHARPPRA